MYVCVCTAITEKDLKQRYDKYKIINPDCDIKEFKRYANVCQQCCKCNTTIRQCWSKFNSNKDN